VIPSDDNIKIEIKKHRRLMMEQLSNHSIVTGDRFIGSVSATTRTGMEYTKLSISLPTVLLRRVDKTRGDVLRSTCIRRALEKYIQEVGR
jgi:hypothetical protein